MQPQVKRYYVVVRGNVQDVGYRKRIEGTAELFGLKGFPWNDTDGSVKIICEGREDLLERFLRDIEIKESPSGISVERLEKKELSIEFPLPAKFVRLETEGLADISRKLDIGNEHLGKIKGNAARLKGIENALGSMDSKLGRLDEKFGSVDSKLDTLPERIAKALKGL